MPTRGLPFEQIAALRPDLVLATDYSRLADDHATLSELAPTLSSASGYNRDTWQVTTNRVGQALGRAGAAADVVGRVDAAIHTAREEHPEFARRTFTIGPVQADGTITTVSNGTDASARFLSELGLVLSPAVAGLPKGRFPNRAVVSPEQLDVLDADITACRRASRRSRRR